MLVFDHVSVAYGQTPILQELSFSIADGEQGVLGALTGGLKATAGGITAAVFFGFLAALVCNPKDKS